MHVCWCLCEACNEPVLCVQVREVGLPGPMDPVLIPVGTGPEQAPETAPLPTILTAVLVTAPLLKHVQKVVVSVSIASQHMEACMTSRIKCMFSYLFLHISINGKFCKF